MIQIARELLAQFADDPVIITQLLITEQDWKRIIGDNLSSTLDPTLVMTNSLQGSVPLVPSDQAVPARGPTLANVAILGRASSYTIELLNETGALREPIATFDKCAMYLVMSAEIMSDALSLKTIGEDNETLATILGARAAFSKSLRASKAEYSAVWSLLTAPLGSIPNSSQTEMNWSYYQARVLTIVAQQIFDKYSFSYVRIEELLRDTNIRRSQDAPHSAAVLLASSPLIQGSAQINKLQNELLNDLTGALSSKDRRGIARLAVLLTIIYDLTEQDDRPLPVSRIVLLLREIFKYCDPGHAEADPIVKFQLIRILSRLSKLTGDGPGGSWEQKTQLLCDTWRGVLDEARMGRPFSFMFDVPLLFATLELYDELHMLSTDNEELHDVLKKAQREAKPSLMRMFLVLNSAPVPHTLPISHTISHLSRATRNLDRISPADYNQLIPLITSHSASVSTAAFVVLHRCIPAAQEQQSIDVALGDSAGSFPPELFPLIISTPETDVIENHTEEEDMDPTLLSFMRTWTLVYDHYRNASFRLRTGYSEQLQKVDQISGLLNTLVSLFTNPATGRLVQIPNGAFQDILHKDLSDNPTVGLLQVYYKTLLHVPVLAKAWYLDLKRGNREIVEQLTEQYVSPNLANEELRAVKAWFEEDQKQTESDGEEQKLVVRVSDNTKEVNLGYEIDDQTMRIMIKLPDAWPLTNVLVESVQRIGVPEEKWQSWLRNTRGVITFSVRKFSSLPSVVQVTDESLEWVSGRRDHSLERKRQWNAQGTERMCHMLLDRVFGQTATNEAMCNLQERFPCQ